jgi:Xaa-Pro aminopeptidase
MSHYSRLTGLLNLRGSDIPYNPVFFAYASVSPSEVCLFVDKEKLSPEVEQHFKDEGLEVNVRPYEEVRDHVSEVLPALVSAS